MSVDHKYATNPVVKYITDRITELNKDAADMNIQYNDEVRPRHERMMFGDEMRKAKYAAEELKKVLLLFDN